jgi:hypothetical protein
LPENKEVSFNAPRRCLQSSSPSILVAIENNAGIPAELSQ